MFERLGKFVERYWKAILVVWGLVFLATMGVHLRWYGGRVPTWRAVAQDGEFSFLPRNMQSLLGEQLLADAFPEDLLKSSVIIVMRRYKPPILQEDKDFIEEVLKPELEKILIAQNLDPTQQIMTPKDPRGGKLLISQDQQAALVVMRLK